MEKIAERGTFVGKLNEDKWVITEGKVVLPDGKEFILEGVEVNKGISLKEGFNQGFIITHREGDQPMLQEVTEEVYSNFGYKKVILNFICYVDVKGE